MFFAKNLQVICCNWMTLSNKNASLVTFSMRMMFMLFAFLENQFSKISDKNIALNMQLMRMLTAQ